MKKFLHLVPLAILCLVLVLLLPNHASAASESDLTFTLNADGASYSVTACSTSASGSLTIPATFNGKPVTSIGGWAFYKCTRLTSVTIPDSVTSIGNSAFYDCTSMTSVTIPNSVTSIGNYAFYECTSLTSVIIPDSVTSIGNSAFSNCTSLTSVNITDIISWCRISFANDYSNPLTYAVKLYVNGELVTDLNIPDSVTSIGNYAFYHCDSLTSVTIPDSVTSIGDSAFNNCYLLTSVMIPDSVTSIGDSAFSNCFSLTSVTIGDSVTSIGSHAFFSCDSLTRVNISDVASWCGISFANDFSNPLTYAVKLYVNGEMVTDLNIPDSVTSIGDFAFYNCDSLTRVTIPDSVTSIGDYAFQYCDSLTGIWVDEENPAYCSDEYGVLYNKDKTTLIQAPGGIQGSYTIPDSVTSVGDYAFQYCASLTSVTIGDSVTSIGSSAFYWCDSMTSVTIGDSVTSIDDWAFAFCDSLASVTIPDSVTNIGSYAFYRCTSLTSVTIPDSVTAISDHAFSNCDSLTSITIPDSVTSIGDYAFSNCDSLTSITIPDGVTSIGSYAFDDCTRLKHVAYSGTQAQWNKISIGSYNSPLTGASIRHYEVEAEDVYYTKNCVNVGMFCSMCNDFVSKEKAASGTHVYENDGDTYCDDCGYTRTVKSFSISTKPIQTQIPLLVGQVDATGGRLKVTYSDATYGYVNMTGEMVSGFDSRVYGQQTLTVTYGGCTATYTVQCVAASTPDQLEVLTRPAQTSYLTNQRVSLTGLTLQATYGDLIIEIPLPDVKMDAVDMTAAGVKTVTVRFYDAAVSFPIYVHEKQTQTIDSALYPESAHNYAANTNETKTFTYPGAGSLVLTFSSQSFTESNYDFVYILDGAGNQIGKYSGNLAGKVVTVPGDTVQIKLTSDGSVNKYGYAFSSIVAETILHPGEDFCEICGELKTAAGKIVLPENMSAVNMTIPAGVTIDLNGHILTVDSLASFGQIIDSVGGGGLIVENIEITGNDWLPIQDSTGCYRFYEYEVENLGTKTGDNSAVFGFALDFADATAYTTLLETDDVQVTVTLTAGDSTQTYAFSRELIAKYVDLVAKHPTLQPYLRLNATGLDSVAEGTIITVTPSVTAVSGKIRNIGAPITYTA